MRAPGRAIRPTSIFRCKERKQLIELRRYDEAKAALDRAQALDAENIHHLYVALLDRSQAKALRSRLGSHGHGPLAQRRNGLPPRPARALSPENGTERACRRGLPPRVGTRKTPDDYFTSPFAFYFLGQPKAATARMDSIMAKATTNKPTMRLVSTHFAATSSRHSPIWSVR